MRLDIDRAVLRSVSQVLGHWRSIHDFARVHAAVRIERSFHLAERVVQLRPKELFVQMTSCQSVSMFTAHAPAELNNEIGNLIGHVPHDANIFGILGVDQWADMKATDTRMTVVPGARTVFMDDIPEPNKEFRKSRWFDGTVFNKGDRFAVALHSEKKTEACLSHLPDLCLLRLIKCAHVAIPGFVALQRRFKLIEL